MDNADHVLAAQDTLAVRIATLAGVLCPFLGLIAAIVCLWGWAFTWVELASLLIMYLATGLGITMGFHRLFAHRSFDTVRPVRFLLAVLGSMSVQGPVLRWVAIHRSHHSHSDTPLDPHSPHRYGGGVRGVLAGLWHAQVGWIFTVDHPDLHRHVRDFKNDKIMHVTSRLFGLWVAIGLLIPTVVGGLVTRSWTGALLGFLWGGLARIFLVHHVTWSINSVCHMWGSRPYDNKDYSRNNFLCGLLALGEGWHNNHHAFPASARHGLRFWQFDCSWLVIRLLEMVGLVWRVRVPSPEAIVGKLAIPEIERPPVPASP